MLLYTSKHCISIVTTNHIGDSKKCAFELAYWVSDEEVDPLLTAVDLSETTPKHTAIIRLTCPVQIQFNMFLLLFSATTMLHFMDRHR